jgi:dihydrodipicolinate synthase/N-acetylneuraminate lyase
VNHFPETLQNQLKNVHTYVVTPFCQDDPLQVDLAALRGNLRFLVDAGVRVVAVCGGTGEFEALSPAEYLAVSRVAQETVGQEALVVATVPGNLPVARDLVAAYESLGIQAVLAMPPLIRGQVPRDLDGVISYFRQLCAATPLAVMPYNTQAWPAEMFCRFAEIDGIIAVKDPCFHPHELYKAIQMLGTRFVWIGNKQHDPGVVQLRYQMGVEAFTSGQSNFWPGPELELHAAASRQDWPRCVELQQQCAPLERLRMQSDDAAMVKAGLDLVGLYGGPVRPPRCDIEPAARENLRATFATLNVPHAGS